MQTHKNFRDGAAVHTSSLVLHIITIIIHLFSIHNERPKKPPRAPTSEPTNTHTPTLKTQENTHTRAHV